MLSTFFWYYLCAYISLNVELLLIIEYFYTVVIPPKGLSTCWVLNTLPPLLVVRKLTYQSDDYQTSFMAIKCCLLAFNLLWPTRVCSSIYHGSPVFFTPVYHLQCHRICSDDHMRFASIRANAGNKPPKMLPPDWLSLFWEIAFLWENLAVSMVYKYKLTCGLAAYHCHPPSYFYHHFLVPWGCCHTEWSWVYLRTWKEQGRGWILREAGFHQC